MYHISDAWKVFANYETSFGSLQYFQLGQGGTGNSTANGLEPEKAKTYEIGTRYDDGGFAGELTAFYIDFDDELQYISNDVGWTNLGATKHQGIEASVRYDLAGLDPRLEGLSVSGGTPLPAPHMKVRSRVSRAVTCRSIHVRWPPPACVTRSTAGPGTWTPTPNPNSARRGPGSTPMAPSTATTSPSQVRMGSMAIFRVM